MKKTRKVLSALLAVCVLLGALPISASAAMPYEEPHIWLQNKSSGTYDADKVIWDASTIANDVPGMAYDRSSNTLTLTDFKGPEKYLDTEEMGDLTIQVVGENELLGMVIGGHATATGLTITGSGTLALNKGKVSFGPTGPDGVGTMYSGIVLDAYDTAEPTLTIGADVTVTIGEFTKDGVQYTPLGIHNSSSATIPMTYGGSFSGSIRRSERSGKYDFNVYASTTGGTVRFRPAGSSVSDGKGPGEDAFIGLINISDNSIAAVIYDREEGVNPSASSATKNLSYNPISNTLSTSGRVSGTEQYLAVYQMGSDFKFRVDHNAYLAGIKVAGSDRDAGLHLSGSGEMIVNMGEKLKGEFGDAPIIVNATNSGEPSFDAGSLALQVWGLYNSSDGAYDVVAVEGSSIPPSQDSPVEWDGVLTSGALGYYFTARMICVQQDTNTYSSYPLYTDGSGKYYILEVTDPANYASCAHKMYEITNWDAIKDHESTVFSGYYALLAGTAAASAIGKAPDGYTQVPEYYNYIIYARNNGKLVQFVPPEASGQPAFTEANVYFDEGGDGVLAEGRVIAYATVTGDTAPTAVVKYTDNASAEQTLELTVGGGNGSYSFTGALPAGARSVQSVVFTIAPGSGDPVTETVTVGKAVKSCLTVTLTGTVQAGSRLSVIDSGNNAAVTRTVNEAGEYDLGYLTPETYSVKVTYPTESGRVLESGSAASVVVSAGTRTAVSVSCSEITVIPAAPTVTTSGVSYTLYWYGSAAGSDLLFTGPGYDLAAGETVYVCAVPTGTSAFSYGASSRVPVTSSASAPSLALGAIPKRTVSGKVTMGGRPVEAASVIVSVTARSGGSSFSTSRRAVTDSSGDYTVSDVPGIAGATVKLSVSYPLAADYGKPLTLTSDLTGEDVVLTEKQGAVLCRWDPIFVSAVANDTDVPVTLRSGVLYLDPDKLTAGETVTIHLEDYNGYADVEVDLDDKKCGKVEDSIEWTFYSRPYFELSNPSEGSFCLLTYDSAGKLVDTDTGAELDGGKTVQMFGNYRSGGTYTFLFLLKEARFSLEPEQLKTLSKLKTAVSALGGSGTLYLEKQVALNEVQGGYSNTVPVTGTLPSGTLPALSLNRASSGLTLDADEEYVSARVSVAPTDMTKVSKKLTVLLDTNQISGSDGPNVNILPGSVYINGKRAEVGEAEDNVKLFPGTVANQTAFEGEYMITIPDVSQYGGYPVTVQWQSRRATSGTVTASALVRFGKGSRQFVGSGEVADPIVSLYVPSSVGESAFTVYGYAPAGAEVNIRMDDAIAASVAANANTGFYSAQITLPDPIGYEEHSFQAQSTATTEDGVSYSCGSAVQKTVYSSSLPHISKIEISDHNNIGTYVLWDNGEPTMGYYWYLPQNPVTYYISFDNAPDGTELESVTVHLPRSDGVKLLEAKYKNGKWETDPLLCGNTPPTGAWVSYVVKEAPTKLTDTDFARMAALENAGTAPDPDKITATNAVNGLTAETVADGVSVKVESLGLTQKQTRGTGAAAKIAAMNSTISAEPADGPAAMNLDGTSQNAVYNTVALEGGKWVYRNIEKISNGADSKALWQETVMTESSYTVTMADSSSGYVETIEYRLDSDRKIPVTVSESAGNSAPAEALEILQTAWAEKVLAYQSGAAEAMSPTMRTFLASARVNEPTSVWDNDSYALVLALLINCINENGGSPGGGKPLEAYCWPREHLGGGLYQNLKWKLGAEKLKVLKDYIDDAMAIAGTGGDLSELGKWAQDKVKDSAWEKFKNIFGGGDDKEIHDIKKQVYDAMIAAEKEGQKIDWSKFPGFDTDFPDPRIARDIHTITKDEKGNNLYGGRRWDQLTREEQEELLNWSKEQSKKREDEKGDAVPDTSKPIIDPSGFVYEGVESNRVQGVTAALYEVNETSGARTLWPAAEYDQGNPQTTDEFGQYQWMVPAGWWSVTFTKDGYTPYTTGENDGSDPKEAGTGVTKTWAMPVPPAQLDVNINLQREDAPAVEDVKVTAQGIYIVFNQYMDTHSLNDNTEKAFTATVNGVTTEFSASEIECKDEENGYARTVLLKKSLKNSDTVNAVEVKDTVKSYTGKAMAANYLQASGLALAVMPKAQAPLVTGASAGEVTANTAVTVTAESGAAIYYTVDGADPTTASTLYTGPVLIAGSMTLKCIAVVSGKLPSEVTSLTFTVPSEKKNNSQGDHLGGTPSAEEEPVKCDGGEGCVSHPFSDVDTKQWYHEAVDYVIEHKLMNGDGNGKFKPEGTLTRAMLCQILYNKEGRPAVAGSNKFVDVKAGQWYTDAVAWAAANEIVSGYGGDRFGPNDPITREQLAAILWRYDGKPATGGSLSAFKDGGKISDFAVTPMQWAVEKKIVTGKGSGVLDPLGKAQRCEVAAMVMRYLEMDK